MVDFNEPKIEIYTGINDVPVAPTATKGGNGSHLISVYNNLIDSIRAEFLNVDASINDIYNKQADALNNQDIISSRVDNLEQSGDIFFQSNFTHWHDTSTIVSGASFKRYNFADQPYNTVTQQEPANLLDSFKFYVPLNANFYQMDIIARTSPDGGVFTIEVNDELVTEQPIDLYTATPAPIVITLPVVVNDRGICTFLFKVVGTTQTGYALPITKISIIRAEF